MKKITLSNKIILKEYKGIFLLSWGYQPT